MVHFPADGSRLGDAPDWKRSNKDLGRAVALALLTVRRDRREGTDEFGQWADRMWEALLAKFGGDALHLAQCATTGIGALLASREDLAQALRIANLGILASLDIGRDAFDATGRRLQEEVLEIVADVTAGRRSPKVGLGKTE